MKKAIFYFTGMLLTASLFSQATFDWAKECGKPYYGETKTKLATDMEGNVIMAGNFVDTAFFGNQSVISTGATDIFLAKHDAEGNLLWLKRDGGANYDYLHAIAPGEDGFYTAGSFYGNTSIGNNTYSSLGSQDIFLSRYEDDGNCLWTRHIGSPKTDYINAIDSDPEGNLIISGHYYDSIAIADTMIYAEAGSDIFMAKYNAMGELIWVRNFGGSSSDQSYSLSCDDEGNILFTGSFFYDIQVGDTLLTTQHPTGVFFAKLNSYGETILAVQVDGSGLSAPSYALFDDDYNIYFTGNFSETVNFGPYSFNAGAFNIDIFITKYQADGTLLWADHGHGLGSDQLISASIGPLNDLYISGHFLDTIHFGNLQLNYTLCCGSAEIFIVRYTGDGTPVWGDQISGVVAMVESMVKNQNDELFISGMFRDEVTFGNIILNTGLRHRNFLAGIDTETMTSIADINRNMPVNIYPNPANDHLKIDYKADNGPVTVLMFNLQGKMLSKEIIGSGSTVDLSHLSIGSYLLTLRNMNGEQLFSKIIVKK